MPRKVVPTRIPVSDLFTGLLLKVDSQVLIATDKQEDTEIISQGELIVRYGIRFMARPSLSIVPELVVLDYGDMLTGENAWKFIIGKSNLYPRSDVLGHCNNGEDQMTVMKNLDLAIPLNVLVYDKIDSNTPVSPVSALIAPDITNIAARILQYLPHYLSMADWRAEHGRQ